MASVECPACGERVKVRAGEARLRCRECGKSFRAPDDDEDEEEEERPARRSLRRKPAKGNGQKVGLMIGGGVLLVAVVVVAVVLIVRGGKDGDSPPTDAAKVTPDNFTRVKPGMDVREVEGILGGGRSSSENDMRDAFRKGLGEIEAGFETAFARAGQGAEWRRWDGKSFRVWVAFAQTKEGKRAAFSTALEQTGGTAKAHTGFMTWAGNTDLDELAGQRKKEDAVRNDPKWTRGPAAQNLVPGEWRNEMADGYVFGPGGKLGEVNVMTFPTKREPTYRVLDDRYLETTHPSVFADAPPPPPLPNGFVPPKLTFNDTVRKYEYFVTAEELALIEATPHAILESRTYYRMPVRAGGVAHTKLLAPMLNDVRTGNPAVKQSALYKLERLGPGAAVAAPELRQLAQKTADANLRARMEEVARVITAK